MRRAILSAALALLLLLTLPLPILAADDASPRSFTVYLSDYPAFLASPDAALLQSGEMPSEAQLDQMRQDWDTLPFPLPKDEALLTDTKLQIVIRASALSYQLRYSQNDLLIRFILPAPLPDESIPSLGSIEMDGITGQIYPGSEGSAASVFFGTSPAVRVNFYVSSIPSEALEPFVWKNSPQSPEPAQTDAPAQSGESAGCASVIDIRLLPYLAIPFALRKRRKRF